MNNAKQTEIRRNTGWLLHLTALLFLTSCVDRSEEYVRENFNKNFAAFKRLEQMQREDINTYYISLERYATLNRPEHGVIENNGLSNERLTEYRKLLKQAGVEVMAYNYTRPKREVYFGDIAESIKGYIYLEAPPPPDSVFESFLACSEAINKEHYTGECYFLLKSNWYYR